MPSGGLSTVFCFGGERISRWLVAIMQTEYPISSHIRFAFVMLLGIQVFFSTCPIPLPLISNSTPFPSDGCAHVANTTFIQRRHFKM